MLAVVAHAVGGLGGRRRRPLLAAEIANVGAAPYYGHG